MTEYPRFLQELLNNCPTAPRKGIHPWLFRVARYLHYFHSSEEICTILEKYVAGCRRMLEPHEIPDAVRNSSLAAWEPSKQTPSERRMEWLKNPRLKRVPDFCPDTARQLAARVPVVISAEWLKARSVANVGCSSRQFLEAVFELQEKVLIFNRYKSQGRLYPDEFSLEHFIAINHPDGAWFLCNPVDGRSHWNPRLLKESRRSEEAVTSWRYAVLECDHEPKEEWGPIWLKILVGLPLPIVAITDSGGRSVHALVRVACQSKPAWDQFKYQHLRPLVSLGADDGALSAVRLTRLPGTYRGDKRQTLLYLNPAADGRPIYESQH